jgi:hypothetical protein
MTTFPDNNKPEKLKISAYNKGEFISLHLHKLMK